MRFVQTSYLSALCKIVICLNFTPAYLKTEALTPASEWLIASGKNPDITYITWSRKKACQSISQFVTQSNHQSISLSAGQWSSYQWWWSRPFLLRSSEGWLSDSPSVILGIFLALLLFWLLFLIYRQYWVCISNSSYCIPTSTWSFSGFTGFTRLLASLPYLQGVLGTDLWASAHALNGASSPTTWLGTATRWKSSGLTLPSGSLLLYLLWWLMPILYWIELLLLRCPDFVVGRLKWSFWREKPAQCLLR